MDCYAIEKPTPGQACNDDTLGAMVWNEEDGTWELAESNPANIFDKAGNWIGTNLNFSTKTASGKAKNFIQKNWIGLMIGGAALLILWLILKKK